MATTNKAPVVMTISEMFSRLTVIMQSARPEERKQFKESWLDSIHRSNAETKPKRSVKDPKA